MTKTTRNKSPKDWMTQGVGNELSITAQTSHALFWVAYMKPSYVLSSIKVSKSQKPSIIIDELAYQRG